VEVNPVSSRLFHAIPCLSVLSAVDMSVCLSVPATRRLLFISCRRLSVSHLSAMTSCCDYTCLSPRMRTRVISVFISASCNLSLPHPGGCCCCEWRRQFRTLENNGQQLPSGYQWLLIVIKQNCAWATVMSRCMLRTELFHHNGSKEKV